MSRTTLNMTDELYQYYLANSLREAPVLEKLREETAKMSSAKMQIAPEEGQFLAFLVRMIGAKKTLDIGVFTGYSSLVVALALPSDGKVIGCDHNDEWTKTAKKYWELAGVSHKIDLQLAPAVDTLNALLTKGQANTFDFIFIDADKKSYDDYYELSLALLRPSGLIAIDNVFLGGKVADPMDDDESAVAIRALNAKLLVDDRIDLTTVPIADGLAMVRKL
jgi:predicted O-methyltransferase YrrM